MKTFPVAIGVLACLALAIGCGGDDDDNIEAEGEGTQETQETQEEATLEASPTEPADTPTADVLAEPTIDGTFPVGEDGHQLALRCWGQGTPVVVLEAGHPDAGITQFAGAQVVRLLAERTMVCTYDRAGEGLSDPAPPGPRDADDVVTDLNQLLQVAAVPTPRVLVGSSFGGMIVTYYAAIYPEGVAGVVLLDVPAPSAEFSAEEFPELVWSHPTNSEHLDIVDGFEGRFARQREPFSAPLVVITGTNGEGGVADQSIWLELSPDARQVELEGGHDIWADAPERVAEEILALIDSTP